MIKKTIFLFFLFVNVYSQEFVVLDKETDSIISNVVIKGYKNNKVVFNKVTEDYEIININGIDIDSIIFFNKNYVERTILPKSLSKLIYLEPKIIELLPIVISKNIVLGENGKVVNRTRYFNEDNDFLVSFHQNDSKKHYIKKIFFHIKKSNYKFAYKIEFYEMFSENYLTKNALFLKNKIFETDTIYVNEPYSNTISYDLKENEQLSLTKDGILLRIVPLGYFDQNGIKIRLENKDCLKIKYIQSKENTNFEKLANDFSGEISDFYVNINYFNLYSNPNLKSRNFNRPAIFIEVNED